MPMGHEKDILKTSQNNVPDVQKETKDITNILSILDSHVLRTNPFGANITGENSFRRAERISAALHLITNHVSENEPLRSRIRVGSLELIGQILDLRSGFRTPSSEKGQATLALIRELVSLARLLAVAGFVSAQNVSAITDALDELGSLIVASQRSTLAEQLTISRDDLTPHSPQTLPHTVERRRSLSMRRRSRTRATKDIKDTVVEVGDDSSTARSAQIMDILKSGGTLGIKDIALNLPQYSEKMVQRELAELVRLNRVQKIGAKRWSKYSVITG